MSPELRHLRCFLAVAEELSFSRAASRLYMTQQALSRTVAALERELGTRLFERTSRSVELTPAGEAMLVHARRAAAAADDAFEAAQRAERGDVARPLRVDISSGGIETGAVILRTLREARPEVAVHQVEVGVARGLELVRSGRLDALLGLATHAPAELSVEVLRHEPVTVGLAEGHPLAALDPVPIGALEEVELLLPSDEAAAEWVAFVTDFCRRGGVTPKRWPGVTHGSVSAAEVVREGRCVVPTTAWAERPAGIVFRALQPAPVFPWSMAWRPDPVPSRELAAFLRCARQVRDARRWLQAAAVPAQSV
jgi:DNA-binding transcriptional LysR family regulator